MILAILKLLVVIAPFVLDVADDHCVDVNVGDNVVHACGSVSVEPK